MGVGEVDEIVLGELVEEGVLGGMDEVEGEALEGAEFEAEAFGAALLGGKGFEVGGGESAVLEAGDVGGGVSDVLPTLTGDGAGAAGAEA